MLYSNSGGDCSIAADISLRSIGRTWMGCLEASGASHIRLRLLPAQSEALPELRIGERLDCTVGQGRNRYVLEGRVLHQEGDRVWVRVPAQWARAERRTESRTSRAFPVEYRTADGRGAATCVNISAGGLRLRCRTALERGAHIGLTFTLPGETEAIRAEGLVVRVDFPQPGSHDAQIAVKFHRIRPADGARIANFCFM